MVGTQIDNFRIVAKIGDGGMGSVYRAVDVLLERDVALKFLRPELARDPDLAERFRAEAQVLARLHHPHIAALYGLHRHGDDFFMAMEYVPGETLEQVLARVGRLSVEQAMAVASMVLDALEYAHKRGIVHRDIKTANIILTPEGEVKVMDFGIARVLGTARRTRLGFIVGTLNYMAPEQIQGLDADGRTDLYALGIVLHEMLAGRLPFEADTEWTLMQAQVQQSPPPLRSLVAVPEPLEAAVLHSLAKSPADRPQSATEFKRALAASVGQPAVPADDLLAALVVAGPALPEAVTVASAADGVPLTPATSPPTRLATPTPAPPPPPTRLAEGTAPVRVEAPSRPASPGAAITWRHYAAGAAVLVLLGGLFLLAQRLRGPAQVTQVAQQAAPATRATPEPSGGGGPSGPLPASEIEIAEPPAREPPAVVPPSPVSRPPAVEPSTPARPAMPAPAPRTGAAPPSTRRPTPAPATQPAPEPEAAAQAAPEAAVSPPEPAPAPVAPSAAEPAPPPAVASRGAETFSKVKMLQQAGEKVREVDVVLELGADRLVVRGEGGVGVVKTISYQSIAAATYSQSKHPRWKEGIGAAVAVGVFATPIFFLKGTKHWLTVQSASDFLVLRLDKNNYRLILPALEARSGKPVEVSREEK